MARTQQAATIAALKKGVLVPRDFLTAWPRNRSTGARQIFGLWSDVYDDNAYVIDPSTGASEARFFHGAGSLVTVEGIQLVSTLQVNTVTITLLHLDETVNDLFREYDLKQAPLQIHRGLYNPTTMKMVASAEIRFDGFVDDAKVVNAAEGSEGSLEITANDLVQELLRTNTETRSSASQRNRHPGDAFYDDTAVVGEWQQFWGSGDKDTKQEKQRSGFDALWHHIF